ncbi:hypothetical protein GH714_040328 [Hevea brasiliensis]|uniref:Uncharacterized protein n=1 Tax=Hevea brasiliensis TaxID=3981 RepID=A0A6A6MQ73_HEVBR|nr:hypothetical protein GH714_040328 [Hevea brasiliensis]
MDQSSSSQHTTNVHTTEHVEECNTTTLNTRRSDDIVGLLRDALGVSSQGNYRVRQDVEELHYEKDRVENESQLDEINIEQSEDTSSRRTSEFENLLKDVNVELYPGCKTFSRLSFILQLYHLKCLNGWTGKSFTMLLELLVDAFPEGQIFLFLLLLLLFFTDGRGRRFRKRGKTTMAAIWNMDENERIFLEVNEFGVPCSKEAAILGSFLGTIATNGIYAPLNITRWDKEEFKPFHAQILKLLEKKFAYPSETEKFILKSVNKKWRDYKSDLKAKYYDPLKTKEQISEDVPKDVLPPQWTALVNEWFTEKNQKMSSINTANAKKQKNAHTTSRKSYARLMKEMEKTNGKAPDRLEFFEATHKRKDGTYVDDNIRDLMEKARALIAERSERSGTNLAQLHEQIFQELMGPEHNGRVRGMGLGPTPSSYFGVTTQNVGSRWEFTISGNQLKEIEELKGKLQTVNNDYAQLKEVGDNASEGDQRSPNNLSSHSSHEPSQDNY